MYVEFIFFSKNREKIAHDVAFTINIVSEIFVDAFSKLKPCRTPTGPPISLDVISGKAHFAM